MERGEVIIEILMYFKLMRYVLLKGYLLYFKFKIYIFFFIIVSNVFMIV